MSKQNRKTVIAASIDHEDPSTLGASIASGARKVIAGITALIAAAGVASLCGWVVESLIYAAAAFGMGVFALNAIWFIGLVMAVVAIIVATYKTWDLIASGRAEEAIGNGVSAIRGWFSKKEEEPKRKPMRNGAAGPARMAH